METIYDMNSPLKRPLFQHRVNYLQATIIQPHYCSSEIPIKKPQSRAKGDCKKQFYSHMESCLILKETDTPAINPFSRAAYD
jgi:hypothetical protein